MAKCMCFDLSNHYLPKLYKWVNGRSKKVLIKIKSDRFWNSASVLDVKLDSRLIEVM